ncbi:GNAT family N-acetyltransferase [Paenibacillus endoradicis]|uniref:GNAT family N-acetyltransferase n=1 Tax=Paenibacillus endoradicis TaxID=2972487 RepID=UPI002158C87C|nr:GNAT family N-acetyltransferase [Paenibacillus endoradicis]MCR8656688.1 GNAT family N-acetyltransferase [Paenibacillus endoradicis]
MIECCEINNLEEIQNFRLKYLESLVAPMDGMWESSIIGNSTFSIIKYNGNKAGYFCVDSNMCLLQFHLLEEFRMLAQDIFRFIISCKNISNAICSTIEPFYLSLCFDLTRKISINSYLFYDGIRIKPSLSNFNNKIFKKATLGDLEEVIDFYTINTEGSGEWIRDFIEQLLLREQLFILYNDRKILGTGECIISQKQKPYADVGMVVSREHRRMGIGTYILTLLKEHCYEVNCRPICSCSQTNIGSKKTIEKAGFISSHRILNVTF